MSVSSSGHLLSPVVFGGRYFEDCNEAATVTRRPADYAGVAWYALDPSNAERLWDTALGLLPA